MRSQLNFRSISELQNPYLPSSAHDIILLSYLLTALLILSAFTAGAQEKGDTELTLGYGRYSTDQLSLENIFWASGRERMNDSGVFYLSFKTNINKKYGLGASKAYERIKEEYAINNLTWNFYTVAAEMSYSYLTNLLSNVFRFLDSVLLLLKRIPIRKISMKRILMRIFSYTLSVLDLVKQRQ